MSRSAIPSWYFVYCVVRHEGRFLFVHERDGTWYLPAGRVEPGERFVGAAVRETLEEAGVRVEPTGILRIEHGAGHDHTRLRIFYTARPIDDPTPRTEWNGDTHGGAWLTLDEIRAKDVRSPEALWACEALEAGAPVHPLRVMVREGAPWRGKVI